MEKSASEATADAKTHPRRSPRTAGTGPSAGLLAAKQNMKLKSKKVKSSEFVKDDYATAQDAKDLLKGKTGVAYDNRMVEHFCLWDKNYPECPERFSSILKRCTELGLISRCEEIPSREATEKELLTMHTPEQVEILKATQNETDDDKLEELSSKYDAVYINQSSYKLALLSAGCTIDLIDAVCKGQIQNGMAIVRPPGHHAMKSEYCGYCFFNNVALAAKQALEQHGLERILIVDWDVHHGQATQQMFYDDPRVVYFSIHRYEHGSFWPELRESDYHYIGDKLGTGFNFNVPLNAIGMKDADYLAIFQQLLLPMAYEFQPQLVIVSAGYDAAIGCPEGEMEITPACYAHLISSLMGLAEGKLTVVLEGGYCLKSLSEGAALTLRSILGDPAPSLVDFGAPCDSIVETILNVIYVHKPYWQCYQLQDVYAVEQPDMNMKMRKRSNEKLIPSIPANRHYPTVTYRGNEIKPPCYATRNCYPVQSSDFLKMVDEKLNFLKMATVLSVPQHRVALVYDERMVDHRNLSETDHPEKPERIVNVFSKHKEYGLLDRCLRIEPRGVTEEELLLVHTQKHLDDMKRTSAMSNEELIKKGDSYDSIYFHPKSYECALLAAGSLLQVVDSVVNGESRSGVAIVRPPGHHAEEDTACGFCLFNNVSLAAKYAVQVHSLQRVLLLDWDVHHGNGSQRMFESDPRVLYISLHRYNNARFFPSSTDADYDKVGIGPGTGFNVNIPWNKNGGGMADGDYISAFHSIVMPIAYQFNPQLVLVSAGFDACINDPLGHCKVTPEAYAHMTHWLTTLANGRVILSLEGGYNVTSISYALTLCTKALLGDPLPVLSGPNVPCPSAIESIKNVIRTHEKYWSCLKFNKALPKESVLKKKGIFEKCFGDSKPEGGNKYCISKAEKEEVNDRLAEKLQSVKITKGEEEADEVPEDKLRDAKLQEMDGHGNQSQDKERGRAPSRDSDQGASRPSPRPTLVGYLSDNMQRLVNQEMFAVVPLPGCPHLVQVQAVPQNGINVETPCATCDSTQENWICLICYSVQCGRYVNQHMMYHGQEAMHPLTLSFTDLSVWCYMCEAYIDNMVLYPAKNAVHRSKFGCDMEWSYGNQSDASGTSSRH